MVLRTFQPIAAILLLLSCSCGTGGNRNDTLRTAAADSSLAGKERLAARSTIDDIIENLASPVEISSILMEADIPFTAEYLAPTRDAENLSTSFGKAIMMGIYGADLGYLNMYGKTSGSMDLLTTIKTLADGLRVGQYFDYETIKSLTENNRNLDSLLFLSVRSYNRIDEHLRKSGRGSLSALMVAGAWLEGQFMATQVAVTTPESKIRDRVGEQKIILSDIIALLNSAREGGKEYAELLTMMEKLSKAYDGVTITYRLGEPETAVEDGRLVMRQREESIVEMTDGQLAEIAAVTKDIRGKLISGI